MITQNKQIGMWFKPKSGGYPGNWTGRFIWDHGEGTPFHYSLLLRKAFNLKQRPPCSVIHITAADKYRLFINGRYVGRGPARSVGPHWTPYDTHDIGRLLRPGKNVIAVFAYHYGCKNGYSFSQRAGVWVEAHLASSNGQKIIGSDATWKTRTITGYRRDKELLNGLDGRLIEIFDATKDPADWMNLDFNDSSWEDAYLIDPWSGSSCWSSLEPRMTPLLHEEEMLPEAIITVGEARALIWNPSWTAVKDIHVSMRLAYEPHYPLRYAKAENVKALLGGKGAAHFQSLPLTYGTNQNSAQGTRDPFIILDFGRPVCGFPQIDFDAPERAVIEMTYSAQLVDGRVPVYEVDQDFASACIAREGRQVWQTWEKHCFRYLQIVFRNVSCHLSVQGGQKSPEYHELVAKNARAIHVHSIQVMRYEYPAERVGRFECSDPILTKLWKAGVDTAQLHFEDTQISDAYRERRVATIVAESFQEPLAFTAGYGCQSVVDWYFRQTTRSQLPDGSFPLAPGAYDNLGFSKDMFKSSAGTNPAAQFVTEIAFYAEAVWCRYEYTGDMAFIREHYPALVRTARYYQDHSDDHGLVYNLPHRSLADWVKCEMRGAYFKTNADYYRLLLNMERLAALLSLPGDAENWQALADRVVRSLRRLHWNSETGLFVNSVIDGKQIPIYTELDNALAVLYDIADDGHKASIRCRLTDRSAEEFSVFGRPEQGTGLGLPVSQFRRRWQSPRFELICPGPNSFHWLVEGLVKLGAADYAFKLTARRYAAMLEKSDFPTHTGEEWEMDNRNLAGFTWVSCIWGGGIVWTLSTNVLGISPLEPGYKKLRIAPKTGNLKWAKGVFPTMNGNVAVSWKKDNATFCLDVDVPAGCDAEIVLPRLGEACGLVYNKKRISITSGLIESADGISISKDEVMIHAKAGINHYEVARMMITPRGGKRRSSSSSFRGVSSAKVQLLNRK